MTDLSRPRITRLRVKNYRSLADIDIELGALNVFVGKNGSGKSSVIDVLRFVRDAVTRGLDAAILDRGGISAIRRWSAKGRPYDVTVGVSFEEVITSASPLYDLITYQSEYLFTLESTNRGEYRKKYERLAIKMGDTPVDIFEANNGKWTLLPKQIESIRSQSPVLDDHIQVFDRELNIPGISSFSSVRTTLPQFELPLVKPGDLLFKTLAETSYYTIYPDILREPQKPANPYPLDERGRNLASVLRELKRNKETGFAESLRDALERVVEGVHDYSVRQVGGYLVTTLHHTLPEAGRQGPAFELAQESDGTLRMLGILTALYQEPPRALVTIEEPEITIHPGALGVLCDVLQEASARSQILVTTHNPDLIDRFPTEALHIVEKIDGITHIGPVSAAQREAVAQRLFSSGELMRIEGLRSDAESPLAER